MERMHYMNAVQIIESLPKRLYHHPVAGTLEYATIALPDDPEKGRRVMIGICHSRYGDTSIAVYVLYQDGSMYLYDVDNDRKLPYGLRYAHLQMLLSESSLHDWIISDFGTRKEFARAGGQTLEDPAIAHQRELSMTMMHVQSAYGRIL